jgi:hypothetical protein
MSAYRTAAPARALPARCSFRFDELPRDSQDLLRAVSEREHSATKRERHTRLHAILVATTGFFVLLGTGLWSQASKGPSDALTFDRHTPWDAGEILTVMAASFVVGAFLLGGIAALVRQRHAPLGTFWYVHKAYLFDCALDRVVAYPLALLSDQEVVGETAQLSFGNVDIQIAFDLPDEVAGFLQPLRQHATTAAALLARGVPDQIPGADFIPEALLYRENPRLPWDRAWALPLFAGAALALVGRLVLPGLHASVAERRLVSACHESPAVCPEYLTLYPQGAHLDDVDDAYFLWTSREKRLGLYTKNFPAGRHLKESAEAAKSNGTAIVERYRKSAPVVEGLGDPRMTGAMLTTLEALRDARSETVQMRLSGSVEGSLSSEGRPRDPDRISEELVADPIIFGLSPGVAQNVRDQIDGAIFLAVEKAPIVLHKLEPGETAENAPAELAVTYRIFKGQRTYDDTVKYRGLYVEIDIDWTLTFRWPTNPRLEPVTLTFRTTPPEKFSSFVGTPDFVYEVMMLDGSNGLGRALRSALGLAPTAPD